MPLSDPRTHILQVATLLAMLSFHRAGVAVVVMAVGATELQAADVPRPKICLALSGGGARGVAHVGVLKVLEELRVPIDCIAGTSMGAVVGGAYASGTTVSEMEALMQNISTDQLLREKPPRQEQSNRRKQEDLTTNLVGPEFGFRYRLLLPKGFVSGLQFERVVPPPGARAQRAQVR